MSHVKAVQFCGTHNTNTYSETQRTYYLTFYKTRPMDNNKLCYFPADTEKDEKFQLKGFLIVKSTANILHDLSNSLVQFPQYYHKHYIEVSAIFYNISAIQD